MNKAPVALQSMGWDRESVRAALTGAGVSIPPVSPRKPIKYSRFRTGYLDGEAQRRRKTILADNEAVILGWAMRGVSTRAIAAAFSVSEVSIHKRLHATGIFERRSVCNGRQDVHIDTPEQKAQVVPVNDQDANGQTPTYEL